MMGGWEGKESVSWKSQMRVPGNAIMIVNDSLDIQARD
jgi:hypothetical protein